MSVRSILLFGAITGMTVYSLISMYLNRQLPVMYSLIFALFLFSVWLDNQKSKDGKK